MSVLEQPAVVIDDTPIRRDAWGAVLLLTVVLFGGGAMLTVFGPLQEAVRQELHIDDFAMSLIQGPATGGAAALALVPLSWIIDHGNRARLLSLLMGLCVVGVLWTTFAGGFWSLCLARMLIAVGATCAISVIISLAADLCAPDKRGRAIVLLGLGTFAGAAGAYALGGTLLGVFAGHPLSFAANLTPWRTTHLVVAVVGAVLLLPLVFLREPPRHEVEEKTNALGPALRALWGKRGFLVPLFVGQLGVTMADAAAGIWAAPVLSRNFHLQPQQFSGWVGATLFAGGILGSVLGGLGADIGQKSGRRGGLLFCAMLATAIGIPASFFPIMPTLGGFQILFFLLLFSGAVTAIVSSTAVTVLIPNEERGACMAAFGLIGNLVGKGLAPVVVTVCSGLMGGDTHLSFALAVTGVVTSLFAFGGYVLAVRFSPIAAAEVDTAAAPAFTH